MISHKVFRISSVGVWIVCVFALVFVIAGSAGSQEAAIVTSGEIAQVFGVQKDNHRYFVAGKNTAVRAFLGKAVEIDGDRTSATVFRNNERAFTLSPKKTFGAVSTVDFLCASLAACQKWEAGEYTFSVTVNGETFDLDGSYSFVTGEPLRVLAVPIKANFGNGVVKEVTGEKWKTMGQFTQNVYPLAEEDLKWTNRGQIFDASDETYDLQQADWVGCDNLTNALANLIPASCKTNPKREGCHDFVVGFIKETPIVDGEPLAGWAPFGQPVVVVVESDQDAPGTVAHELAHKFGIGDTYDDQKLSSIRCSVNPAPNGFKGRNWDDDFKLFDGCTEGTLASTLRDKKGNLINGAQVSAASHPYEPSGRGPLPEMADFMSAGDGPTQSQLWITPDIYDWLYRKMVKKDPAAKGAISIIRTDAPRRFLVFSGYLSKTGDVRLEPWRSFTDTATLGDTTGPLMVQALDSAGQVVASTAFSVQFFMVHPPRELTWAAFEEVINFPPTTVKFQIVRNGVAVAERLVSANPPVVGTVTPQASTTIDGLYTIRWTGSDPDLDTVTYTVAYTTDSGDADSPWIILADNLNALSWEEDFSKFPGGKRAMIQVTANDGVISTEATSAEFIVPFKAPEVFIDELPWGDIYKTGSDILLVADVFDIQDETISPENIVWTSSIAGEIGRGAECLVKNLSKGLHVITATAVNTAGLRDSDMVNVLVSDGGTGGGSSGSSCFITTINP